MAPTRSPSTVFWPNWLTKSFMVVVALSDWAGTRGTYSGSGSPGEHKDSRSPALCRPDQDGSALQLGRVRRAEQLDLAADNLVDEDRVGLGLAVVLELDGLGHAREVLGLQELVDVRAS